MNSNSIKEILQKIEEQTKKQEKDREPYIVAIVEKLGVSKAQATDLLFDVQDIAYSPSEFAIAVEYFCQVFNGYSNLVKLVKEQAIIDTMLDIKIRKKTIFNLKPYTMFGERLDFLGELLQIDRNECIALIISKSSWLYYKEDYFSKQVTELCALFELTIDKLVTICKEYNFVLTKEIPRLSQKIEEIADYYNVDKKVVKDLMIAYPPMMNYGVRFYKKNGIDKDIFERKWLVDCIVQHNIGLCDYRGYRTFHNFVLAIKKIEKDIGKVEKVYIKDYHNGEAVILMVKKDEKTFLVTVGSNAITSKQRYNIKNPSPEQKLLDAMFGTSETDSENQEWIWHQEYICELNPCKTIIIEDVLHLLSAIAVNNVRRETSINKESSIYYLSNTDDICQCSLDCIEEFYEPTFNLNVDFYKVEPMGDGKIRVESLKPSTDLDVDLFDIFDEDD